MRGSMQRGKGGPNPPQENHNLFGFLYFDPLPPPPGKVLPPPPPPHPENVGPSLESWKIIVFFKKKPVN